MMRTSQTFQAPVAVVLRPNFSVRSRRQPNRSIRPTGTASGDDYNDDVMLTFERAPKSRTPKFSSNWPIGPNLPGKKPSFVSRVACKPVRGASPHQPYSYAKPSNQTAL